MTSANSLVALFEAMTQNIEYDRTQINSIDRSDGDAGDNLAGNFRLITDTLAAALGDAFTPEVRSAWTALYGAVESAMKAGALEEDMEATPESRAKKP